ncbi:MAG: hypothetical protein KBG07_03495 [Elusimicrobia bacterium]|nr:hypothetical protein [Elusimicrobiota bacterium]MBP9127814.1 hypothetical protein [Elusimicrobiota bacterium]
MKLYVDDVRTPPPGWVVARTVKEAIAVLDAGGVDEVSLDYFIGDGEGGTFLPVAHHIAAMTRSHRPKKIHFHTASSAGAARLASVLGQ